MKRNNKQKNDKRIKEVHMSTTTTKMPYKYVKEQQDAGILTEKQVEEMISKGMCASPVGQRGVGRLYIKDTNIEPTLYFKGVGNTPYTKEMKELRKKFNLMKKEYCVLETSKKELPS